MKTKVHVFTVMVRTSGTKKSAELALLCAFSTRSPDNCEFKLIKKDNQKKAYMAGSLSGVQLGFEMSLRAIEGQMKQLKIKRNP